MKQQDIQDVFDYVNQRYVFNNKNYPIMKKLTDEEKIYFALKHILLHMQKNIVKILHYEKIQEDISLNENYKKVVLKILVNIITLSYQLKLTPYEIYQLGKAKIGEKSFGESSLVIMTITATFCESFDHEQNPQNLTGGVLGEIRIKESVKILWRELFCNFSNQFGSRFTLTDALLKVGSVMKSV